MDVCKLVQNAAISAAPEDIRQDFAKSQNLRNAILDIVYSIDGYEDMPHEKQRAIYDEVRLSLIRHL